MSGFYQRNKKLLQSNFQSEVMDHLTTEPLAKDKAAQELMFIEFVKDEEKYYSGNYASDLAPNDLLEEPIGIENSFAKSNESYSPSNGLKKSNTQQNINNWGDPITSSFQGGLRTMEFDNLRDGYLRSIVIPADNFV